MAQTQIPWGDPRAVKRWSPKLATDVQKDGYFSKRFVGKGSNNIVEEKTELEADSGDTISFDLVVHLRGEPTFGDDRLEGKEEALRMYTDVVQIDQVRKAVSAGGKMSRQRVEHDLRMTAKDRLKAYWAKFLDELHFMTLAGARGSNEGFTVNEQFNGFAGNALLAPDANHLLFGGTALSKATITAADKMTRELIERASVQAEMMQATNPEVANMVPLSIEGNDHYVCIMSPFQAHDMRMDTGAQGWAELQKAAMGAEGSKNRVFRGGLGMINNVILHAHQNVIRFRDYGAAANLPAARAIVCGRQASAMAYGTTSGRRFIWEEQMKDYGNEPSVAGGYIMGVKKARFHGSDFGVMALDTYAKNPNAA